MKKTSLLVLALLSTMLPPALADSIRPGSRPLTGVQKRATKSPTCLVLEDDGEYVEEKWKPCDVIINDTGVIHPMGHITTVVQWTTEKQEFSVGGAAVGAVAGTGGGMLVGLGSCAFTGPFCLLTAPAIMSTGTMVGGGAGGHRSGKFYTIIGNDINGNRLILEFKSPNGKTVKQTNKLLLSTTQLAEGELRAK